MTFYFFFRRILNACLLAIPLDNTYIFLQYVFILMSSHTYVLYLVSVKPYQTNLYNNYVLANETFYSALIIAIFIFSDATPELTIKIGAAIVLIASVNGMIFANFVMVIVCLWKGRDQLKEDIKQAKMRRAEKELKEEEEEEERRQRQLKEEEEFTKLPDEATDLNEAEFGSDDDKATPDIDDDEKSKKRKKKRKSKKKVQDTDMLAEYNTGEDGSSTLGNTTSGLMNDTDMPLKDERKKKKKKRSKKKANQGDDLVEAETEV